MRSFPIWKTVTLGTFSTHDALRRALLDGTYVRFIDDSGDDEEQRPARTIKEFDKLLEELLVRTPLAPQRTTLDLVRATLPDLGFTHETHPMIKAEYGSRRTYAAGPEFHEIADRIWRRGYRLCPPEVGPQLRLQCPNQQHGLVNVAIEPVCVSAYYGGRPHIYMMVHDVVGRSIMGNELKYGELCTDDDRVFVKPRKP